LRDEDCVAHLVKDSGKEDGQRREGHVGAEEHECGEVVLGVGERL